MIYISIAIAVVGLLIALFEKKIVGDYRSKISLIALYGGSCSGIIGGFYVNEATGFFAVCVVLLVIAFLFGYDRG